MANFFVYFYSKNIPQNLLPSNEQKVTSNVQKLLNNEQRAKSFTSLPNYCPLQQKPLLTL